VALFEGCSQKNNTAVEDKLIKTTLALISANGCSGLALAKLTFSLEDYLLLKVSVPLAVLTTDCM